MSTKRLATYGALVVVLAVVVYFVQRSRGPEMIKALKTTIVLVQTGEACGIPGDVGKIVARNRDGVTFHVINNCNDAYIVRLGNFRPNGAGPANDNVLTGSKSVAVAARGSADIIGAADTQGQSSGVTYKYDIFIRRGSGPEKTAKDPDYEIWP